MKSFKKLICGLSAALSLTMTQQAHADASCQFDISVVSVTPAGWIATNLTSPTATRGWFLCPVSGSTNVNDGYGSTTIVSETCKTIYTQLLSAKASNRKIQMHFVGISNCGSSIPADGFPSLFPAFIQFF